MGFMWLSHRVVLLISQAFVVCVYLQSLLMFGPNIPKKTASYLVGIRGKHISQFCRFFFLAFRLFKVLSGQLIIWSLLSFQGATQIFTAIPGKMSGQDEIGCSNILNCALKKYPVSALKVSEIFIEPWSEDLFSILPVQQNCIDSVLTLL